MTKYSLINKNDGTTTIEFALMFPVVFFITFMGILLLFWVTDSMILTYEANRLNRLHSVNINLTEEDDVYKKLILLPTVNVFKASTFAEEIVVDTDLSLVKTTITSSEPTITPFLIQLLLAEPGEVDSTIFQSITATSYRVKESYILSGNP